MKILSGFFNILYIGIKEIYLDIKLRLGLLKYYTLILDKITKWLPFNLNRAIWLFFQNYYQCPCSPPLDNFAFTKNAPFTTIFASGPISETEVIAV